LKLSEAELRQALIRHLESLRRFCYALTGTAADGDDLAQNTVERLLDKGVPDDVVFPAWMFRVCKNLWIDHIRKVSRVSTPGDEVVCSKQEAVDGTAAIEQHLQLDEISAAMQALDKDQRLVMLLVVVQGHSYREAAEIMEVPIGTGMSRLARARCRLLNLMSKTDETEQQTRTVAME